jgi:gliding motility-associated-like protein
MVTDEPLHCFVTPSTFSIIVLPLTTVDVPSAFTPNGDGVNDEIFPDGWGIRNLIYFRIFNRWGQLVFETNVYRHGWDGMYQGVPQNMDTYMYQAEVETFIDEPSRLKKSGTFKLIR